MNNIVKPSKICGKTIKSINSKNINCWKVTFTDNTSVCIWMEADGPLGLPRIWLESYIPENLR